MKKNMKTKMIAEEAGGGSSALIIHEEVIEGDKVVTYKVNVNTMAHKVVGIKPVGPQKELFTVGQVESLGWKHGNDSHMYIMDGTTWKWRISFDRYSGRVWIDKKNIKGNPLELFDGYLMDVNQIKMVMNKFGIE